MTSNMAASVRADLRTCANLSFQLVLWSVSSSKLLPDNVEQYLTLEHESFHLATKTSKMLQLFSRCETDLDRSFDDILHVIVMFSE